MFTRPVRKPSLGIADLTLGRPGVNLINIQRQGLRLRLEKASTSMLVGLRLGATFESYKHRLEAYLRT
jgi:hypothetical protein